MVDSGRMCGFTTCVAEHFGFPKRLFWIGSVLLMSDGVNIVQIKSNFFIIYAELSRKFKLLWKIADLSCEGNYLRKAYPYPYIFVSYLLKALFLLVVWLIIIIIYIFFCIFFSSSAFLELTSSHPEICSCAHLEQGGYGSAHVSHNL